MATLVTKCAALAGVEFTAETVPDEVGETLSQTRRRAGNYGLFGNALEDVVDEGVLEKQTCFELGNAALLHIEKSGFIELSDGAAVVALYVVGVDFEHWLREGAGIFADAEVGESLLGSALLGARLDEDFAVNETCALSAEYLLIEHIGSAVLGDVLNENGLLDVLVAIGNDGTGKGCRSAFADEPDVNVTHGVARLKRDVDEVEGAACVLFNLERQLILRAGRHIKEQRGVERGALL